MIKINMFNKPQIKLIDFGFATYIPKNREKITEYLGTREYAARKIIPKEDEIFIDLVKDLGNKTPKTVTHLVVNCIKSEKTTTIY